MEYFRSGLKSVLGAPQTGAQPTGAETVERLVNRVETSTLLDDRRDACRALKALSKKYRLEVGAQGMNALRQVLELDRTDSEIVGYCLDTLCNITSKDVFDEEDEERVANSNVGEQFTEMFVKTPDNVSLVLSFLEEFDFRVRWPAIRLLTCLLANKPKEIQHIILISPMCVSKLMDLLQESREIVRNDALLLLIELTKSNANIQKIVAFENAFDRLFEVIREEGYTDGGIVVKDCLVLMLNLLKNNTSNINLFKEGPYIQKLAPMFVIAEDAAAEEVFWSHQKIANFHCVLQLVRCLVSPNNPVQITSASQKSMRNANLLEQLCSILMASGVPADILTETINTVAEVIRGNLANQEYFANVIAPSNPPRPVLVVLLMSMVNEKQPFLLRCAVLYCFQSFLFKNEIGQMQVVQTLLPSATSTSTLTTGQLLCGGLFSHDTLSNWFSSVALSHCLIENPAQKEQLLRVLLAPNLGQPVTLIHQVSTFLQQTTKFQTKLGILILLSAWLAHCQQAVQLYLNVPGSVAFLTAQTSADEYDNNEELMQGLCAFLIGICLSFNDNSVANFSRENLSQLIEKRVTLETFVAKLSLVSRHEVYAKAAKQPQLKVKFGNELLLDFEFCKLFKALESVIMNALGVQRDLSNGLSEMSLSEHENALLLQYKELIREQDKRFQAVQVQYADLVKENVALKAEIEELKCINAQYKDENTIYKAQMLNSDVRKSSPAEIDGQEAHNNHQAFIEELQVKLKQLQEENTSKSEELKMLRKDQEDFLELLSDQDLKLNSFKSRLRELGETIEDSDNASEDNDSH